jgi:RimJ/RimL family protein N-acetyltransferase
MFASERVRLRAVTTDDAPALFALAADPETHLVSDNRPIMPTSVESLRHEIEKDSVTPDEKFASFVATTADGEIIGTCCLWGVDQFNQLAHIGVTLMPAARGQGYGPEIVRLLCRYGFRSRNLRRLEIETLASNVAMRKTAEACGFTHEGIQREREYDGDGFADIATYGMLRTEWKP